MGCRETRRRDSHPGVTFHLCPLGYIKPALLSAPGERRRGSAFAVYWIVGLVNMESVFSCCSAQNKCLVFTVFPFGLQKDMQNLRIT